MLPKGTRDFLPADMARREYVIDTISQVFKVFGYKRIETPAIELNKTLSGKYGEEGDRLMFKVMPRGEKLQAMAQKNTNELKALVEEALRYDLTVPFARFVVDHRNELTFPFKRFQIQSVWRADRPQKGRYREFTQCDADVVGIAGMVQEAELLHIYDQSFGALRLPVQIRLNHRGLLQALAESLGAGENLIGFTTALDKLDKVGWGGVAEEWQKLGLTINADSLKLAQEVLTERLPFTEGILRIESLLGHLEPAKDALMSLKELEFLLFSSPLRHAELVFDLSLARGLDYYTACIFEVAALGIEMGSIGGGGRYDNLTGVFGLKDTPGVGISFGIDRIELAMQQLELFSNELIKGPEILFAHMGKGIEAALKLANRLRQLGIITEVYPTEARLKKQIEFAAKTGIRFLAILGEEELAKGELVLKDLEKGLQLNLNQEDWLEKLEKGDKSLEKSFSFALGGQI